MTSEFAVEIKRVYGVHTSPITPDYRYKWKLLKLAHDTWAGPIHARVDSEGIATSGYTHTLSGARRAARRAKRRYLNGSDSVITESV